MFFQHYCWTTVSQPCQKEQQLSLPCKLIIKVHFSELLQQQIHQISSWNYRGWGSAWAPPVSPKQFGEALRAETWDKPGYKPREMIFLLQSCSGSNLCTDFFFSSQFSLCSDVQMCWKGMWRNAASPPTPVSTTSPFSSSAGTVRAQGSSNPHRLMPLSTQEQLCHPQPSRTGNVQQPQSLQNS